MCVFGCVFFLVAMPKKELGFFHGFILAFFHGSSRGFQPADQQPLHAMQDWVFRSLSRWVDGHRLWPPVNAVQFNQGSWLINTPENPPKLSVQQTMVPKIGHNELKGGNS